MQVYADKLVGNKVLKWIHFCHVWESFVCPQTAIVILVLYLDGATVILMLRLEGIESYGTMRNVDYKICLYSRYAKVSLAHPS